jgi:universal stress protein A
MKVYNHILVAVELISKTDAEPIKRAAALAKEFGAKLSIVNAIENLGGYGAYGVGVGVEVEKALIDNAQKEIYAIGKRLGITEKNRLVRIGPAKFVILEEAKRLKADLIIVGSHGRHGVGLILGSTANAVLHGAKCDVLAVRLKK